MKNNFQRRSFLKLGLTLGASSLIAPKYANAHILETEEDFKFTAGPYLQTNFNNSITVLWLTNKLGTGWVEYGEEPTNLNYKAYSNAEMGLRGLTEREMRLLLIT
ncbi:hypothetical protein [Pedobacter sp. HDW13]|uniref:hypothetical protein n=1 Tax=Pedobacter sp. HDW13 TaxID=2714940 RepID=UPI001980B235|nr:hypothetical protein [Pedobacter sp. HDW13]